MKAKALNDLNELFGASEESNTQGQQVCGIRDVARALNIPLAGAREWAWATGLKPVEGRYLLTREQAEVLCADPCGARALHAEVARLRAEVRMHQGIAERRQEAQAKKREQSLKRQEELTKLRDRLKGRTK